MFKDSVRQRLVYVAMSALVAWHSAALLIAPTPDRGVFVQSARAVLQPYLSLFRLDNQWNFFAPRVGRHYQFRYIVETKSGRQHVVIPVEEASTSVARYVMWREVKYFYEGVMEAHHARAPGIIAMLCRSHADLDPVSITLMLVQERDYTPFDYLDGRRPMSTGQVMLTSMTTLKCK